MVLQVLQINYICISYSSIMIIAGLFKVKCRIPSCGLKSNSTYKRNYLWPPGKCGYKDY